MENVKGIRKEKRMFKYKCPTCGAIFHSSSESKENEPCEICGNPTTELVKDEDKSKEIGKAMILGMFDGKR